MSAPCPVFGFIVTARLRDVDSKDGLGPLVDDLVTVLESNGLVIRERGHRNVQYAVSREGSQATHADRELVLGWSERWRSVAEIDVSDLVDLQDQ